MSSHPGVDKVLELLQTLKQTVSDIAGREEKLNREYRLRIGQLRQQHEQSLEEANGRLTGQVSEAVSAFQVAKQAIEARLEKRRERITEAHRHSRTQRLNRIDHQEGVRTHRLQTETLQSEKNHKDGLANNEATYEDFKRSLAEHETAVAQWEATAQGAFKGFGKFHRLLSQSCELSPADLALDEYELLHQLRDSIDKTSEHLGRFRKLLVARLFRPLAVWIVLALCCVPLVPLLRQFGIHSFSYAAAIASTAGLLVLSVALHLAGKAQAAPLAGKIAGILGRMRPLLQACAEKCEARHASEIQRIENEYQATKQRIQREWNEAVTQADEQRQSCPQLLEDKKNRASGRNESTCRRQLEQLETAHRDKVAALQRETEANIQQLTAAFLANEKKFNAEQETRWRPVQTEWDGKLKQIYLAIQTANADAEKAFPPWQPTTCETWKPPTTFSQAAKFGRIEVNVAKLADAMPKDPRLQLPGCPEFSVPLLLTYPEQGSILLETNSTEREALIDSLNNIILRLLSTAPPGRLSFTVIDPVGLGQSFSGVMHMADYAEHVINSRIWTQSSQIEQKLAELNEHMEKVIQMYLRNEYATIAEYNEQAGNIAEKYHFLVVADFPVNFTDTAARRLMSIASSGARCGVYTLIHWDRRQPMPQDFVPEELRKSSVCITGKGKDSVFTGQQTPGMRLLLDAAPDPDFATRLIHKIGLSSRDSNRVEVPFSHVAPPDAEIWSMDTRSELRVPIGRTGATKLQYLAIGKGTRQHALLAGKTGSGKSTLFHVMITNLALWCSPDQVEFYLVDFKKGVEFKCYGSRRLPHARVVAIESDREFGLSVLQRVDDELKRRGDMFRKLGVQDIAGYKKAGGKEAIPRTLLIIDEFQELFVEDDKISQTASLLLDRIVRQGRAFGIHVLLGSQTLGGAYTVARTTLGQMVIRIALQCNEADAYLIMDDTNPAPRLLSRPGEGIYNDAAGALEGNSPFQVVWLPDEVRDSYLAKVRTTAEQRHGSWPGPIVFEGNAPADVREHPILQELLRNTTITPPLAPRIWLGAPNSIKGPTEAIFHKQSGNNLLLVGQREEATLAIFSVALLSLAAQYPTGSVNFIMLDGTPPGLPGHDYLQKVIKSIPHPVQTPRQGDLPQVMGELVQEMKKRAEDESQPAPITFLLIHGLQKFNKLRYEEDFSFSTAESEGPPNPAISLNNLLTESTRLGFHVIASCDTYNNVNRFLSRKAFSEFELRVLFQMSANDSASLIDSPKASTLGLHRALFFNEQEGYLETFRPYALPSNEWIEEAGQNLARLSRKNA